MKAIDKSKKSNIKCEHCGHWVCSNWTTPPSKCVLTGQPRRYYQRCNNFIWREDKAYIEAQEAHDDT